MNHVGVQPNERTDNIRWCLQQAAAMGVPTATTYFFDKDVPSFNAAALVAIAEAKDAKPLWDTRKALLLDVALHCSDVELDAARYFVDSMRRPDVQGSASRIPTTNDELRAKWPELDMVQLHAAAQSLFSPYVPSLVHRGVAQLLVHAMDDFHTKLEAQDTTESYLFTRYYKITNGLRPFATMLRANSDIERHLSTKCLRYAFLCNFHSWKAIEDKVSKMSTASSALQKEIIAGFRAVIGAADEVELQAEWQRYCDRMKAAGVSERFLNDYLKNNWLDEWRVMFAQCWRASVPTLHITTTNHVEVIWRSLKNNYLSGKKVTDYTVAIEVLVGLPWIPASVLSSLAGHYRTMAMMYRDDMEQREFARSAQYLRRVYNVLLMRVHLQQMSHSADARVTGRFVYSGHDGGWALTNDIRPPAIPVPLQCVDAGRADDSVRYTVKRAREVSDFMGPTPELHRTSHKGLSELVEYLRSDAGRRITADFDALRARVLHQVKSSGVRAWAEYLAWAHLPVLDAMDALRKQRAAFVASHPSLATLDWFRIAQLCPDKVTVATLLDMNASVAACVKAGMPALARADFKSDIKPKVGQVYGIVVEMPAEQWKSESQRVLIRGETSSCSTSAPDWAYVASLNDAHALAEAACANGRSDALIAAIYIGQEMRHRHSDSFGRAWEHGGPSGNKGIRNLFNRCGVNECTMPAGDVRFTIRTLAFFPATNEIADIVEASCLALLLSPGAIVLNGSPTGDHIRFFEGYRDEPSKSDILFHDFVGRQASNASPSVSPAQLTTADLESPWLRRAFYAVGALMQSGRYMRRLESTAMPLSSRSPSQASAPSPAVSSAQLGDTHPATAIRSTQLTVWDIDVAWKGHSGYRGLTAPCTTDLSANRCSCAWHSTFLCPHLLHSRLVWLQLKKEPLWADLTHLVVERAVDFDYEDEEAAAQGVGAASAPPGDVATIRLRSSVSSAVYADESDEELDADAQYGTPGFAIELALRMTEIAQQLRSGVEAGRPFSRKTGMKVERLVIELSNTVCIDHEGVLRGGSLGRHDKSATDARSYAHSKARYVLPQATPAVAAMVSRSLSVLQTPSPLGPMQSLYGTAPPSVGFSTGLSSAVSQSMGTGANMQSHVAVAASIASHTATPAATSLLPMRSVDATGAAAIMPTGDAVATVPRDDATASLPTDDRPADQVHVSRAGRVVHRKSWFG